MKRTYFSYLFKPPHMKQVPPEPACPYLPYVVPMVLTIMALVALLATTGCAENQLRVSAPEASAERTVKDVRPSRRVYTQIEVYGDTEKDRSK